MNKEELGAKLNMASRSINSPVKPPEKETLSTRFSKFMAMHPNLVVNKQGKQYLRAEAWQFLLAQVGLIPSCECITLVHRQEDAEDKFVGVKVEVSLNDRNTGQTLSRSMMVARANEAWLKDKDEFAVYGLAQTRAISRAARNVYGWVAAQAGFETVPVEELP